MALLVYLLRVDIRARWRSLVLLMILVTVVVAAMLTALAGARRTETAFDRYLETVRPFDAVVTPPDGVVDLRGIEDLDGVEAAVGFHWYAAFPGDLNTQFFPMIVPDDDRVPETYLRTPVIAGRRPDPTAPLEVALSERSARTLDVTVGDALPVATFTHDQMAAGFSPSVVGGELVLDVVGILRAPGDVVSRDSDIDLNFLTPAFAATYGDEVGLFSVGTLIAAEPGTSLSELGTRVQAEYPVEFESFFGTDTLRRQAGPTLDAMATGMRIVALVLALVGGTAIVLALVRAVAERLSEREALSALGLESRGLLAHLGLANALAAILGCGLGAALSVLVTPASLWGVARRAEGDPGLDLDLAVAAGGMLICSAALLVAIVLVAWAAERRERRRLVEGGRPSGIASRAAGWGAPPSTVAGLRLALERGRGTRGTPVAAGALAAGLGGLGVVAALVFSSSLHHAVTTPALFGWAFDAVLAREVDGADQAPETDEAVAELAEDPSFSAVAEYVLDFDVHLPGGPERAVSLQDIRGHTPFVVAAGHEPRNASEVAIGAATLEDHDLAMGDEVTVSREGHEATMEIVGVSVLPVNNDGGLGSSGVALHRDALDALGFDGVCEDNEPCSRGFAVTAADGIDVDEASRPYLGRGLDFVAPSASSEVVRLTAVDRLPRLVAGFLAVVSVITLAHAAAVTVRRRRRDLAMLRVLGFSGRDLRNTVRVQVAALSLVGAVVGVILGLGLGRQLWRGVASSVSIPTVIALPAPAIVLVPLVIAVLAQIGAAFSRRAAGRIPAAVALRAE